MTMTSRSHLSVLCRAARNSLVTSSRGFRASKRPLQLRALLRSRRDRPRRGSSATFPRLASAAFPPSADRAELRGEHRPRRRHPRRARRHGPRRQRRRRRDRCRAGARGRQSVRERDRRRRLRARLHGEGQEGHRRSTSARPRRRTTPPTILWPKKPRKPGERRRPAGRSTGSNGGVVGRSRRACGLELLVAEVRKEVARRRRCAGGRASRRTASISACSSRPR